MIDFKSTRLYGITNKKYLSELLKIELYKLKEVERYFTSVSFIKLMKNGKSRPLFNPPKEYKLVLKRMNQLLQQIPLPSYVLDLKDFFPSTSESYVYGFFRNKLNMSIDIARICTILVTEANTDTNIRCLPQGFSTSPVLSYLCYYDMFNKLMELSNRNEITYTCYYDDFTFSSKYFIEKKFRTNAIKIIKSYDLKVNIKKTKLVRNVIGVKITGAILKDNVLFAPNKLQGKMYSNYKELEDLDLLMASKKEIIKLCNVIQGCSSAIKSIERQRTFPHISKRVKEIRDGVKKRRIGINKKANKIVMNTAQM